MVDEPDYIVEIDGQVIEGPRGGNAKPAGGRVGKVVDGHDFDTLFLVQQPENRAADASKSIDCDSHHLTSPAPIKAAIFLAVSRRR